MKSIQKEKYELILHFKLNFTLITSLFIWTGATENFFISLYGREGRWRGTENRYFWWKIISDVDTQVSLSSQSCSSWECGRNRKILSHSFRHWFRIILFSPDKWSSDTLSVNKSFAFQLSSVSLHPLGNLSTNTWVYSWVVLSRTW